MQKNLFSHVNNFDDASLGANIRGEWGETLASLFFIQNGYRVLPSGGDWYPYDLTVERYGEIRRIQVKTVQRRGADGCYDMTISDTSEFDALFVICGSGEIVLIPTSELKTRSAGASRKKMGSCKFRMTQRYNPCIVMHSIQHNFFDPKQNDGWVDYLLNIEGDVDYKLSFSPETIALNNVLG